MVEYSIPLLNDINNIDGYLDAYRNDDKRIIKDDRQYVYFACACALKKDFNEGYEIIKKGLAKKDLDDNMLRCSLILKKN